MRKVSKEIAEAFMKNENKEWEILLFILYQNG
jgi:hypothetical protein